MDHPILTRDLWQVTRDEKMVYAMHLWNKTCDCRRWDMTGIPCSHAISAIYKSKQQPEDFVSVFFKKTYVFGSLQLGSEKEAR
jgi:hypothetical protein